MLVQPRSAVCRQRSWLNPFSEAPISAIRLLGHSFSTKVLAVDLSSCCVGVRDRSIVLASPPLHRAHGFRTPRSADAARDHDALDFGRAAGVGAQAVALLHL